MTDLALAAQSLAEWWELAGAEPFEPPPRAAPALPVSAAPAPAIRRAPAPAQPAEGARAAAASAKTVAELRAIVERFDGCGLKQTARTTVFADGAEDADVLLLGEAPGREEDEIGKPFVGRSGQLLDRMLASIGLDRRSNILISNVIYWRPPGNREPTQQEVAICMPFVERLIALKRPKLLVLAGGAAAKAVLRRQDSVSKLRGRKLKFESPDGPVNALVMLHPAYLLRRPQEKRLAWADLQRLENWAGELGISLGARP